MSSQVTGRLAECLADHVNPDLRKAAARAIGVSSGSRVLLQLGPSSSMLPVVCCFHVSTPQSLAGGCARHARQLLELGVVPFLVRLLGDTDAETAELVCVGCGA